MNDTVGAPATPATTSAAGSAAWIAFIAGLTVVGSYAYACAAPFAAVAALAALTLGRTEGLLLVVVTWLINQAIGFTLLSFPHTFDTYAWGVAIGAASVAGYLAARAVARTDLPALVLLPVVFLTAFVLYQVGLFLGGMTFTSAEGAFSTAIVQEVFAINAVAFVGFALIHRAAVALSLVKPIAPAPAPATA